jgi:hypothetical protein
MSRDWAAVRKAKDAYWRERIARLGLRESWRMAEQLRLQALRQTPGWPDDADRQADFLTHVRVSTLFRRADSARGA